MQLYACAIVIGLSNCQSGSEPMVTFSEPQPANTDNLKVFPYRLLGRYLSLLDSSTLIISEKSILRSFSFSSKIHPSQIDQDYRVSGDSIINTKTKEVRVAKREGDSLVAEFDFTDTLFLMDYDNVLRKFKGYYFMNKRKDKQSWEVKKIDFTGNRLIVGSISTINEIENLKTLTESTEDTTAPYNFSTTKKQFKDFLKKDGFRESEKFVRVK
ncbi:MAG: hypothetical protein ACKO1U_09920 [Bacteroidota bacterium]